MMKSAIKLGEYGIYYQSRALLKEQVVADFIAKFYWDKNDDRDDLKALRIMFINGSAKKEKRWAGILLRSPKQIEVLQAV